MKSLLAYSVLYHAYQHMFKLLIVILLSTLILFGCGNPQSFTEQAAADFYENKEDHFGTLVFDRAKVDTFFQRYSPVHWQNDNLKVAFEQLQKKASDTLVARNKDWDKHTDSPASPDYALAGNVLGTINNKERETYFQDQLTYLFFFDCLPGEFQYKWVQTRLGDFEWNTTFFNRLRINCKLFDEIIYGKTGYWDENIRSVFKHDIFNEITKENARLIKACIISDTAFNDNRLKTEKDNFIMFLDKVTEDKWRLFLIDKN